MLDVDRVRFPVERGISKWVYRQVSQEVCPWNVSFASELNEGSPPTAREVIEREDARALAREILGMSQEEFATEFRRSPMKRVKLRGLQRNAAVVLGTVGSVEDMSALAVAVSDDEPLV